MSSNFLRFKPLLFALSCLLLACQQIYSGPLPPAVQAQPQGLRQQSAKTVQTPSGGTLSGNFRLHPQVQSQHLSRARDVLIWLPPGYDQNPQRKYPVLYMHDGNNLFDRRTTFGGQEWEIDERAGKLIQAGAIAPMIIVGVYNTPARMEEYTWYPMELDGQPAGGQGAAYARFLVEELKPQIDRTYRTLSGREHTSVMGSSLGGLISFYLGLHYPQVFGQIGMMSPSVWWKDRAVLQDVPKLPTSLRLWVDMGTAEGQNPEKMLLNTRDLVHALEQQGFEHYRNLAFHVEPGGSHNEASWAARIERPLRFFYGSR
ncbi:MAG: esterase [Candidatus Melainabacteria bacterium HGW-Melainabacteria-1]|nr:MAG: esterase [Candidatus Melainabacteria bacterium HGW-Melainabacteria-1]